MNKLFQVKDFKLILLGFFVFVVISCQTNPVAERFTFGERSLVSETAIREKAIEAIASGNYDTAQEYLTEYFKNQKNLNDPEARIFLNNLENTKNDNISIIAVAVPISSNRDASLEILRGVAHAQRDINNLRNDNQRFLKVLIVDDDDNDPKNKTEIAEQVAKKLGEQEKILGVVGHYSSDTSQATAEIYKKFGLVSISPVSTSVELTNYSDYFFRTVPNDKDAAAALARYAQTKVSSVKATVFYNSDSGYSRSLRQEFITELGRSNIILMEDSDCDLATWLEIEDWSEKATQILNKAKNNSANLIMLASSSGQLDKALEIVKANQRKLPILAGDDVYSPDTLNKGKSNALGMVIAVAWDIEANNTNSDFPKHAEDLWGTPNVNWRTITAYDAVQALMKAIDNQTEPTREGIKKQLSSRDFSASGAFRDVSFKSGDYAGDIQLVEVKKNGSSYDFLPLDSENSKSVETIPTPSQNNPYNPFGSF